MNKYEVEVLKLASEVMLKNIKSEFSNSYFIVGRTDEHIVLGDGSKNVKFSRGNGRVLERAFFDKARNITRK